MSFLSTSLICFDLSYFSALYKINHKRKMKILFLAVVCAAMCGGGYSMSIDPGDENII